MGAFWKGFLIGAGAGLLVAGSLVPFGETKESLVDRLLKEDEE